MWVCMWVGVPEVTIQGGKSSMKVRLRLRVRVKVRVRVRVRVRLRVRVGVRVRVRVRVRVWLAIVPVSTRRAQGGFSGSPSGVPISAAELQARLRHGANASLGRREGAHRKPRRLHSRLRAAPTPGTA